jgi:tetratricopeptide (TPR) repeat protein
MKRFTTTLTILSLLLLCASAVWGQEKSLKRGDKLFKSYKYNAAIPYFEHYLDKEKKKKIIAVKTKLAYCYRMSNKFEKAEKLYTELVQNPKARPITYFYYAESLMANGKYDEAKSWFIKYEELRPQDTKVAAMIEACDKVKSIRPHYDNVYMRPLELNTEADDFSPVFYDGGVAFLSDRGDRGSTYAWTGRPFLKLYKSDFQGGQLGKVKEFSKKINEYRKNTGPVAISRDGQTMIITRNSDVPTKANRYNLQLFETKKKGNSWTRGKLMNICKKERNYMHPALSSTGDTMYFVSDKAGSVGGTDIYMTYRTPKGWKRPINLGEVINTTGHEAFPFVHLDGTLYFASKGHAGYGGFDIFKAEKDRDGEFNKVINLGSPINGPKDDTGFILDNDGLTGYFASSRMAGNDDIFYFQIDDFQAARGEEILAYANDNSGQSLNANKSARKLKGRAETIQIKGKIIDAETGKSLRNVKVILSTRDGLKLKELQVDAAGNVTGVLNKGEDYIFSVSKIGYTSKTKFITTKNANGSITPTFKLRKQK